MRILFTRFPLESAHGGAEIQTISLMKGLSERGHAVGFVGSCSILVEKATNDQLSAARFDIGPPPVTKWHAISFAWRKKKMQQQLFSMLDTISPKKANEANEAKEAIFMLSLSEKLLLTEESAKRGIKVFWVEHDRVGRWLTKNPWLPKLRELSKHVATITVSELSKKIYIDLGWDPEKVITIPNGVDVDRFTNPKPHVINNSQLKIGCIARLTPDKGVDLLVEAVKDIPEATLTIVGTGRDEGYIRKLIGETSYRATELPHQQIRLLPSVSDLGEFYHSLDLLVLPARDNDPFGMVAAEAMMLGIPVIVTDQCGIAGYLKDGEDAIVVEANSSKVLKEGIKRMLDEHTRMNIAGNGKRTALEKFSLARMIEQYESLLR